MRRTLALLAAAGSVPLGVATASPALASADTLVCSPGANGGNLVEGVCVLPAGHVGQPYEGFIITSANSGGTFKIVAGRLPPGLVMPASFGASGTIVGGTPTAQGTFTFTVAGVDQQGGRLRQAYRITIHPPLPLTIVLPAGGSTLAPGTVGVAYAQNFFLSGGMAPYTWSVAAGTLPPGLDLVSTAAPADNNNQLAGTPTAAGALVFTMKVTDGAGRHATHQFSLTIQK